MQKWNKGVRNAGLVVRGENRNVLHELQIKDNFLQQVPTLLEHEFIRYPIDVITTDAQVLAQVVPDFSNIEQLGAIEHFYGVIRKSHDGETTLSIPNSNVY